MKPAGLQRYCRRLAIALVRLDAARHTPASQSSPARTKAVPSIMKVTRPMIVARGLTNRCPHCGGRTLFVSGSCFRVNRDCPACGFKIEREGGEGFYLGSMSLNFGVTLTGVLMPMLGLAYYKVIGVTTASIVAATGAVIFPALFYRSSRSWWLMNYYIFPPQTLPANQTGGPVEAGR